MNIKVLGWKWPWEQKKKPNQADGGLLKGVVATSTVSLALALTLAPFHTDHIRFYAELSWESSAKSVSIFRPQSSTDWIKLLMIIQEMYFGQKARWWRQAEVFLTEGAELWTTLWHTVHDINIKKKKKKWLHNLYSNIWFGSIWSSLFRPVFWLMVWGIGETSQSLFYLAGAIHTDARWHIQLLVPSGFLNKGHLHQAIHQSSRSGISFLFFFSWFIFTVSCRPFFCWRGKVSNYSMHNQSWVGFWCQRWLSLH